MQFHIMKQERKYVQLSRPTRNSELKESFYFLSRMFHIPNYGLLKYKYCCDYNFFMHFQGKELQVQNAKCKDLNQLTRVHNLVQAVLCNSASEGDEMEMYLNKNSFDVLLQTRIVHYSSKPEIFLEMVNMSLWHQLSVNKHY